MRRSLAVVASLVLCAVVMPRPIQTAFATAPVTTPIDNGDPANRLDVVVLGDGYTAAQMANYHTDVGTITTALLNEPPFSEYQSYFNEHVIDVVSNESGADHPEDDPQTFVDTALDATYNCAGIERLICVDDDEVLNIVTASLAADEHDIIIVLVNDPEYGGSGGVVAVASTHPDVTELVLHELGHSFGLLADEYGYPNDPLCQPTFEPSEVDATKAMKRSHIKWKYWIDPGTPLPTTSTTPGVPGLYEGARYCKHGMFRPTFRSRMRALGFPYEQINDEQLVRRIYTFVSPIDASTPGPAPIDYVPGGDVTFDVTPLVPVSHALDVAWTIDGVAAGSADQFHINFDDIERRPHTVRVTVTDATPFVRKDPNKVLEDSRTWQINVPDAGSTNDAWVWRDTPASNYGADPKLNVQGGLSRAHSYLTFDVTGITQPVTSATLYLTVRNGSDAGASVRSVANTTWTEGTIDWNNAPAISSNSLDTVGPVRKGDLVAFDVGGVVTGNGTYSFALTSTSGDVLAFSSKEGIDPPQLIVTQ